MAESGRAAEGTPIVFVVDDDASFRRSTERLIRSAGFEVRALPSATEFLRAERPDVPSCLVLDVRMPGPSGMDLQRELSRTGPAIPIVFVTGHGDVRMSVEAMKAGAIEFLTKPFRPQELIDAIRQSIERDRRDRAHRSSLEELRTRYATLTPRERQVMAGVVAGQLNKQIAAELGTSEITIKVHRARVMHKMQVQSVAKLVEIATRLGAG